MPISSIAQILFRLFALHWFIKGIITLASLLFVIKREEYFQMVNPILLPSIIYLIFGILIWMLSPKLARLLARGDDREVTLAGVTERQLYTAVFVGLGLYFTLSSFSEAFFKIQNIIMLRRVADKIAGQQMPSYYDLGSSLLTCLAGILVICTSTKWAKKLSRKPEA